MFPEAQILNKNLFPFCFLFKDVDLWSWKWMYSLHSYFYFFRRKETLLRVWVALLHHIRMMFTRILFFHILTNNLWDRYISICTLLKYIILHERVEKMCCARFDSWRKMEGKKKLNILYNWDHYCTYLSFLTLPFLPVVFLLYWRCRWLCLLSLCWSCLSAC